MPSLSSTSLAVLLFASLAAVPAGAQAGRSVLPPGVTNPDAARVYVQADVDFMQGMIPHHAQAVKMGNWAVSHGASSSIQLLCERMVVSQRDEIRLMQTWLRDRGEQVPDSNATHMKMKHGDLEHDMLMPGMLSDEELEQLDKARGTEWDRLFLTFMIKHHQGALSMVDTLLASYGAAQDDFVYKLAADIQADQEIEIDRMTRMLAAMPPTSGDR